MREELFIKPLKMSVREAMACAKGLAKIRRLLNSEHGFTRLLNKGVKEINVWNPLGFYKDANLYPNFWGMLMEWIKGLFWQYDLSPEVFDKDLALKGLMLLKDALNDQDTRLILIQLGTRGFIMPRADDYRPNENDGIVGILNHRGCQLPNFDYSIRKDGSVWYHD